MVDLIFCDMVRGPPGDLVDVLVREDIAADDHVVEYAEVCQWPNDYRNRRTLAIVVVALKTSASLSLWRGGGEGGGRGFPCLPSN